MGERMKPISISPEIFWSRDDQPNLKSNRKEKSKKHSYKEEVSKKEKEIQEKLHQMRRQNTNRSSENDEERRCKSEDQKEDIHARDRTENSHSTQAKNPQIKLARTAERTYGPSHDTENQTNGDNNPEKEGNLIDSYRRCKKENDTLVERLSNIEKDKSLMNKKVEKQKKKIQKLKRKLVKEQVKCKNLDCQIEELQRQNSELEIEVNSQRAWSKAISKVDRKYSKNENMNNNNKSKEIHLKSENLTLLSKTCAVKGTPSKLQKPSAAADSYRISGIVPIASSTPTLNR